jgi:hypothetical protein
VVLKIEKLFLYFLPLLLSFWPIYRRSPSPAPRPSGRFSPASLPRAAAQRWLPAHCSPRARRRRPLSLTCGALVSSRSLRRCPHRDRAGGPSPTRRPCPRRLSARACSPGRILGLFNAPRAAAPPPRPNPSSRAVSRRRRSNPSAPPSLLCSDAVAQSSWSPSEGSQGGEEEDCVIYLRPCAPQPRRWVGLAGAPPPRLSAVRRPAPSSPPLEVTVLLVVRFWTFRCDPRDKWSTPAPKTSPRRRSSPTRRRVPRRRRPPTAAAALAQDRSHYILFRRPRLCQPPLKTSILVNCGPRACI